MQDPTMCYWHTPNPDDPEDKKHRAGHLLTETAAIEQRQAARHELNLWNSTLYTNRILPGFRWGAVEAEEELWPADLRTENLVESIGEAMLSKASSSPLKPSLVPHGKSLRVERAVRLADQFLFGVWRQTEAENACVEAFRDAYMADLGTVLVSFEPITKTLHVESVFFDNVIIDNRECGNRSPPRTYRIRQVLPRTDIEARYGVKLGKAEGRYHPTRTVAEGWDVVVTAWRLPDAKGEGGYHMTACAGEILRETEWKQDWVPLVSFHWQDRTSGYFTKSGCEQVVPYQIIQNELNDSIRKARDITCVPRLLRHAGSSINVDEWDNEFGRILDYSGIKPEPFVWQTDLPTLEAARGDNKAAAYSHMGLSEAYANADLPSQVRLDSSAGVREFRNMEDSRHLRLWTNFERFRLMVARTIMRVLGISKGAKAFTSVYHPAGAKARAKDIPWEAVRDLNEDQFSWTMEATPLSEMSPAARRETLRDWTSRGIMQADDAPDMERNPNLERIEDWELAAEDDILRHIDLLEQGEYEAPTNLTNTTMGIRDVTANYHRLKGYEDVEPEVLQNHLDWIVEAVAIQQQATTPPTPVPFAPTQGVLGTSSASAPPAFAGGPQMMAPAPQ